MATEKRLIDANALLVDLKDELGFKTPMFTAEQNKWIDYGLKVAIKDVKFQPTLDAVEVADMKEFAKDVVYQFGCYWQTGERLYITSGGLSTLERAFDILGWEDPHPIPECECEIDGCHEHATCGTPTDDGYKRVCGRHFAEMDGDGNGT
jgi:hypothetical protein